MMEGIMTLVTHHRYYKNFDMLDQLDLEAGSPRRWNRSCRVKEWTWLMFGGNCWSGDLNFLLDNRYHPRKGLG